VNASARRRTLAGIVQQRGSVAVSELAAEFGCSEMTIRRDLDALGRDGVVRRWHGSAVTASLRADEKPYPVRAFEASEAKERIGRAVAAPISDGETVALDAGTTTAEVGRPLRDSPPHWRRARPSMAFAGTTAWLSLTGCSTCPGTQTAVGGSARPLCAHKSGLGHDGHRLAAHSTSTFTVRSLLRQPRPISARPPPPILATGSDSKLAPRPR
jgi:hypothetical protein